jgi:hypothetical protein
MRIQEMKSGMTHLKKRMPEDERDNLFEFYAVRDVIFDELAAETTVVACDLDEPNWSVVSFDRVEARGLTHAQAAKMVNELHMNKVAGLCLLTDTAASRIR